MELGERNELPRAPRERPSQLLRLQLQGVSRWAAQRGASRAEAEGASFLQLRPRGVSRKSPGRRLGLSYIGAIDKARPEARGGESQDAFLQKELKKARKRRKNPLSFSPASAWPCGSKLKWDLSLQSFTARR